MRRTLVEVRRLLTLRKREAFVFLQLDDPSSYLLSHFLAYVRPQYHKVNFRFLLCQSLSGEYAPQPAMQAKYAMRDAVLLAAELGVPFLDIGETPPMESRRHLLDFLANEQGEEDFADTATKAFALYWRGDAAGLASFLGRVRSDGSDTNVLIGKNQLLLRKLGHFQCASIYYAGEWYRGVERLHYLVARLNARKLNRYTDAAPQLASLLQSMKVKLPAAPPASAANLSPLELYYALPDPASHLALQQASAIARAFGVPLKLRLLEAPKRAAMPKSQLRYKLADTMREAERLKIPFGTPPELSQPRHLMPAYFYARSQKRECDFLQQLGNALFVESLDASSDEGLKTVTDRSGLSWPDLQASLGNNDWQQEVSANEEAMLAAGHWSAPLNLFGGQVFHGHDRDWLLVQALEAAAGADRG